MGQLSARWADWFEGLTITLARDDTLPTGPWRTMPAGRATHPEVGVVAAVLATGSGKAAAHRLGPSHSTVKHHLANARSKVGATTTAELVWILAPRLPEPQATSQAGE